MPDTSNDIAKVTSLIKKDFGFSSEDLANHTLPDELKEQLTQVIRYLLDRDFERLLQAMYRLDIHEEKFKRALNIDPPSEIAPTIAQLVIDREMQKVITRKKYS